MARNRVGEAFASRLVGGIGRDAGALSGQESFFFADPVAVALAGVVPFLAALVEALPASFGEPFLASRRHAPLLGYGLGVAERDGHRLFGDIFRPARGFVALGLQGRAEIPGERVEGPLQDVFERHRSNQFSYLTTNQVSRTIPITTSRDDCATDGP